MLLLCLREDRFLGRELDSDARLLLIRRREDEVLRDEPVSLLRTGGLNRRRPVDTPESGRGR